VLGFLVVTVPVVFMTTDAFGAPGTMQVPKSEVMSSLSALYTSLSELDEGSSSLSGMVGRMSLSGLAPG
jgi:hypothetical protein